MVTEGQESHELHGNEHANDSHHSETRTELAHEMHEHPLGVASNNQSLRIETSHREHHASHQGNHNPYDEIPHQQHHPLHNHHMHKNPYDEDSDDLEDDHIEPYRSDEETNKPVHKQPSPSTNMGFSMTTTPGYSFRNQPRSTLPPLQTNVQTQHREHGLIGTPTSAMGKPAFNFGNERRKSSVIIKRVESNAKMSRPASPRFEIDDSELQPYDSRHSISEDHEDGSQLQLIDSVPPLRRATDEESTNVDGDYLVGSDTPSFLRPSASMESISSLAGDPTMQADVLRDEDLKKLIEKELTAGGNSAVGSLFNSAHNAAERIEKRTGISVKDKIPHVFSGYLEEESEKPKNFLKRAAKKISEFGSPAPILLPSQKRTLKTWFLKRSRNAMRFTKKQQRWRREHMDEESVVDSDTPDFRFENDSTAGDDEDQLVIEEPTETKPRTWRQKVSSTFRYFFTGKEDKIQSKVLYKDLSPQDRMKVHSLLIGRYNNFYKLFTVKTWDMLFQFMV